MIFCTKCKRMAPEGDYCPWCLRSWGASLCEGCGHRNPAGCPACVKCRGLSLSDAVVGIRLGWVAPLLAGLALIWLLKLVCSNLGFLLSGGEEVAAWGVGMLSGTNALIVKNRVWDCFTMIFLVLPLIGYFLSMLPGQGGVVGGWLRNLPLRAGGLLWHGILLAARTIARSVTGLFFGKKKPTPKPGKGGKGTP